MFIVCWQVLYANFVLLLILGVQLKFINFFYFDFIFRSLSFHWRAGLGLIIIWRIVVWCWWSSSRFIELKIRQVRLSRDKSDLLLLLLSLLSPFMVSWDRKSKYEARAEVENMWMNLGILKPAYVEIKQRKIKLAHL